MFNTIMNIAFEIGFFIVVFIAPAMFNTGLVLVTNEYKLSKSQKLQCWIPIYGYFYSWKHYYGTKFSLLGISTLVLSLTVVARYVLMYTVSPLDPINIYSVWAVLFVFVLCYVARVVYVYMILNDSALYSLPWKLLLSVTVVFGYIVIGKYMPNAMRHYYTSRTNLYDTK